MRTVVASGAFDPLHRGHLALFRQARALGDRLVVIVEADEWVAKKHRVQQRQEDRAALVAEIAGVDKVLLNDRADGDCSALVIREGAAVFAVGRDHQDVGVIPEYAALSAAGIRVQPILTDFDSYRSSKIVAAGEWRNPIPMVAAAFVRCGDDGAPELLLSFRRDNGLVELPGGFVECEETLEEAVAREVKEELGVLYDVRYRNYLGSWAAKYRDGRELTVAAFRNSLAHYDENLFAGFKPTPEVRAVRWVSRLPETGWDNEVDARIAAVALKGSI